MTNPHLACLRSIASSLHLFLIHFTSSSQLYLWFNSWNLVKQVYITGVTTPREHKYAQKDETNNKCSVILSKILMNVHKRINMY